MKRSQRRRLQRERQAEIIAAGQYVPRPPRSHFQRTDIASVMRADMQDAPRAKKRLIVEPEWQWRSAPAERPPVSIFELE